MGALWQIGGGGNINSGKEGRVVDGAIGVGRRYDIDDNPSLNLARRLGGVVQSCIGRADDKGVSDKVSGEASSAGNVDLFDGKEVPESAMAVRGMLTRQIKEFTTEPFVHSPAAGETLKRLAHSMPYEVVANFHECFFMPWGKEVMEIVLFHGEITMVIAELRRVAEQVETKERPLPEWVNEFVVGSSSQNKENEQKL